MSPERRLFGWIFDGSTEDLIRTALAPPQPSASLWTEDGGLLRIEGRSDGAVVERRVFEGTRTIWEVIGLAPASHLSSPLTLAGEVRSLRRTEHLRAPHLLELAHAFETGAPLPGSYAARRHDGEDGRTRLLAGVGRDPRPVAAWSEVDRFLAAFEGPAGGFALSVPDRMLVGVMARGAHFQARLRTSRPSLPDGRTWSREVELRSPNEDPAPLRPDDGPPCRTDALLTRGELRVLLESLYRYESPAPGFVEVEVGSNPSAGGTASRLRY
ncbi:MAG: hypothetical protein AAFZ18_29150 [Myxococcota bacterium]